MRRQYRKFLILGAVLVCVASSCSIFIKKHPDVFNESFVAHAYCIRGGHSILLRYASAHTNELPYDPRGYADAIRQLGDEAGSWAFSGPGYAYDVYEKAKGCTHLPDETVGRVYVQGLCMTNNPNILLLFDKHPTAGGSHCHFLAKVMAPLGREVLFLDGRAIFMKESEWPSLCTNQIQLLIKDGFPPERARKMLALDEHAPTSK